MKQLSFAVAAATLLVDARIAAADSTPIAIEQLQFETVYEAAERSILATDAAGKPLIVLLKIADGKFLPPRGGRSGRAERLYTAGTVLVVLAQDAERWATARATPSD
ncbi:MAG: hypothetical protein IPG25_17640 [Proteobacteria bacterium]|nr:hypothetical protein [Pseudomonadota bacterium]